MGRRRKGSAFAKRGTIYVAVSTWRAGAPKPRWSRRCIDVAPPPAHVALSLEYARTVAEGLQASYDASAFDPWASRDAAATGTTSAETTRAYAARWCDAREAAGLRSVRDDRGRLRTWLFPELGDEPIATVTRVQLEQLRDDLDEAARADTITPKTAENVWVVVAKMFKDAAGSKRRELRVRPDNPAAGLAPPDKGRAKSKVYLYPSEATALLACEKVPRDARELYAVTSYAYLRSGEVGALDCADIDLVHEIIRVHCALDGKTGEVRETKTAAGNRTVPIEPSIKPLLALLVARRGTGRLFPVVPTQREAAKQLREHLKDAGVTRADLFANDRARKHMTFHDLRASGCTWAAVRGDDAVKIQRRAGHESLETTLAYIREAENRRAGFGVPFPPLPPSLLARSATGSATGPTPKCDPPRRTLRIVSARGGGRTLARAPEAAPRGATTVLLDGRTLIGEARSGDSATGSATRVAADPHLARALDAFDHDENALSMDEAFMASLEGSWLAAGEGA